MKQPAEPAEQTDRTYRVHNLPLLIIAIMLLVVGGGILTYASYHGLMKLPKTSPTTSSPVVRITDPGVTWLPKPEKLDDLKLLKGTVPFAEDSSSSSADYFADYYKMGNDNGQDIIYARVGYNDPSPWDYVVFLKKPNGTYAMLARQTTAYNEDRKYIGPDLATGVTTDTNTIYKSLQNPKKLSVAGVTLTETGAFGGAQLPVEVTDPTNTDKDLGEKLGDTAYGTVYHSATAGFAPQDISSVSSDTYLDLLYLQQPDSMIVNYQLDPSFLNDANVPQITWKDGTKNTDVYRYDGGGECGSASGVNIARTDITKEITPVGTTNTGEMIYGFTDSANPIVQAYYNGYAIDTSQSTYDNNQNLTKMVYRNDVVSLFDFNTKYHGVLVYKDGLNRFVIFTNTTYGLQAECGKPVVYLYPTQTTRVSVKVDARIDQSEPAYGSGWDVVASPNGTLRTDDEKTYDSLYWEGQGNGPYPWVNSGFVVSQNDLVTTLASQLKQLGLNQKETADFLAFWLPRLPQTPYVRLSWFGTKQMNALAPLTISPKPDTVIRIFLDAEGLQQPISLPAEKLSAIPRTGFTVVEWGGLLRKASH